MDKLLWRSEEFVKNCGVENRLLFLIERGGRIYLDYLDTLKESTEEIQDSDLTREFYYDIEGREDRGYVLYAYQTAKFFKDIPEPYLSMLKEQMSLESL